MKTNFLQEDNGNFSATRLAFLLWIIGTGKVVQKFGEKPGEKSDDKPAAG